MRFPTTDTLGAAYRGHAERRKALDPLDSAIFGDTSPELAQCSHLGVRRLWEQRDRCHVVHAVPIDASGAGWYLFRLD